MADRDRDRRRDDSRGGRRRRDEGDRDRRDRREKSRSRKRSRSRSGDEPRMKGRPSGFDQKNMMPENYAMMQMRATGMPPPMGGGMGAPPMVTGGGGMIMSAATNTVTNPEVELFLQHNPVEPHAATRLRSLPVELQKIVLSRGSLFGGRDPTAVLLGRVRAATRGMSGAQIGMGGQRMPWSGTTFMPDGGAPPADASQPPPQAESAPKGGPKEAWETENFGADQAAKQARAREAATSIEKGSAAGFGPFRSKARNAPVATEPDPMPETPIDFNPNPGAEPAQPEPAPEPEKPAVQQAPPQNPHFQQQQNAAASGMPALADVPAGLSVPFGMPPPPGAPESKKDRLWAPSAQDLADLGVPPGIAVRMIRENKILADEDNMPIIPYEGTTEAGPEVANMSVTGSAASQTGAVSSKDSAGAKSDTPKDAAATEMKRAQAIATLSYYGLTDPTSQEDVGKAVQAVAEAIGDQQTAVALWHMIIGSEEGDGTSLTDEQIVEVQEAAQQAQYSQYWLQQQFQSQLAMFENQRLMATGDNPVDNPEDAKKSASRGNRGDPAVAGRKKPTNSQPMLPGDWTCPGCGDHQFARNRVCRFCGASRPIGSN